MILKSYQQVAFDTVPDNVYTLADEMPRFPGCEDSGLSGDELNNCAGKEMLAFIYNNLKYPQELRDSGKTGTTIAQFIVRKDGVITDEKIVRTIGYGTDEVVLEIIRTMPNWRPGYIQDVAVDVQFTLPVRFKE